MLTFSEYIEYVKIVRQHIIFHENVTKFKIWNYMKMQWNRKVKKSILLSNYPYYICLGTGPICNLRCNLCPEGQKRSGRKSGFLGKEVVERVIEELGPFLYVVELYNWGEPLLNKNLFEYIRLLEEANIHIMVSTNLNVFNDNICREIINSGLDTLIVSLDGCSQESVEQYQIGSNYERVISNVKKIVEYKKLRGVNHPVIHWRYIVNHFNENELKKAYKVYKEVGFDAFDIAPISCDMGREILWDQERQFSNVESYLPKNEFWSKYDYKNRSKKVQYNKCSWLWNSTVINWNGSVSPCYGVWKEAFDFGNILETSFKEIWNGKKYQLARRVIKSKESKLIPNLICSICKKNNAILR